LKAVAETIDRPRHDNIEFALCGISAERVEGRALIPALGAADAMVLIDFDDLAAHPVGNLAQLPLLIRRRLVDRRDPEIQNRSFHVPNSPGLASKECSINHSFCNTT